MQSREMRLERKQSVGQPNRLSCRSLDVQEVQEESLEQRDGACVAGKRFRSVNDILLSKPCFAVTIHNKVNVILLAYIQSRSECEVSVTTFTFIACFILVRPCGRYVVQLQIFELQKCKMQHRFLLLNFRHRASCVLGQAFRYSPENAFCIFNQQIYFII